MNDPPEVATVVDSWRTVLADQHCGPPSDPLADLRTRLTSLQLSVRQKGRAPGPNGAPATASAGQLKITKYCSQERRPF